jgi:hypothetical protein
MIADIGDGLISKASSVGGVFISEGDLMRTGAKSETNLCAYIPMRAGVLASICRPSPLAKSNNEKLEYDHGYGSDFLSYDVLRNRLTTWLRLFSVMCSPLCQTMNRTTNSVEVDIDDVAREL